MTGGKVLPSRLLYVGCSQAGADPRAITVSLALATVLHALGVEFRVQPHGRVGVFINTISYSDRQLGGINRVIHAAFYSAGFHKCWYALGYSEIRLSMKKWTVKWTVKMSTLACS